NQPASGNTNCPDPTNTDCDKNTTEPPVQKSCRTYCPPRPGCQLICQSNNTSSASDAFPVCSWSCADEAKPDPCQESCDPQCLAQLTQTDPNLPADIRKKCCHHTGDCNPIVPPPVPNPCDRACDFTCIQNLLSTGEDEKIARDKCCKQDPSCATPEPTEPPTTQCGLTCESKCIFVSFLNQMTYDATEKKCCTSQCGPEPTDNGAACLACHKECVLNPTQGNTTGLSGDCMSCLQGCMK
ncbi:MAG: hypothetical protein KAI47_06350, partial [Deltaproteobacteria bacterium]|nr:hypothetical protein [Deltaproteobacteria bacterium]